MIQPDTDPRTIEWARKPPAPLLEALETLHQLWRGYGSDREQPWAQVEWWEHAESSYQTAYNVMLRAMTEEYAP
jgi:hypothetical protein